MIQKVPTLEQWYPVMESDGLRFVGTAYGIPHLPDGEIIQTSLVIGKDGANRVLLLGSLPLTLGTPHPSFDELGRTTREEVLGAINRLQ